ncbi:MAG TPA: hypothetical protein VNT20_08025 [Flavisolibacter sp.]|jgi:hypothetical protein|nr:hypothetical protein [Flavisolibacter sp.]
MLKIDGIDIKDLPFEELQIQQEIVEFDGIPVFVHYTDKTNNDIVSYLVDFDANGHRRLFGKINKQELFDYLIGIKSLRTLFSEISSDFIFFVDYDKSENFVSAKLSSKYLIPEKYLPVEESHNDDGLSDFYLDYLKQNYYDYVMKLNSFIVKVESPDQVHGKTVGARETAIVLNHYSTSVEGYIDTKVTNVLRGDFIESRIKRRASKTKNFLSPRIADARPGNSIELWLAIDTPVFKNAEADKYDEKIKEGLIDDYKRDVLDVDYTSEEDAKIIAEKYTPEERKKIFEPIYRLLENNDFKISIYDTKNTIQKNKQGLKSNDKFWKTLLPPPSIEELQQEQEKKHRIVTVVLNLEEGQNITKLTKKSLQETLLFTQEGAETVYQIKDSIIVNGKEIVLKKPIKCVLVIDVNNYLQLYNERLGIGSDGHGDKFNEIVESVKTQFFDLVENLKEIEEKDYPRAQEIKQYI